MADAVSRDAGTTPAPCTDGLIPVVNAVMNVTQGAIMAKAGLAAAGLIESPTVRLPLVAADEADRLVRGTRTAVGDRPDLAGASTARQHHRMTGHL